jgi:general secretion pathway protein I
MNLRSVVRNPGSVPFSGRRRRNAGLSLLEVILAIAILGGCIAVIGELVRLGARQAEEARELTTAQLLCESKLEEIAAGVYAPESVGNVPFETDPRWSYSIEVGSLDTQNLIQVTVSAQQIDGSRLIPLSFSLTRWMLDPTLEAELAALGTMGTSGAESSSASSTGGQ